MGRSCPKLLPAEWQARSSSPAPNEEVSKDTMRAVPEPQASSPHTIAGNEPSPKPDMPPITPEFFVDCMMELLYLQGDTGLVDSVSHSLKDIVQGCPLSTEHELLSGQDLHAAMAEGDRDHMRMQELLKMQSDYQALWPQAIEVVHERLATAKIPVERYKEKSIKEKMICLAAKDNAPQPEKVPEYRVTLIQSLDMESMTISRINLHFRYTDTLDYFTHSLKDWMPMDGLFAAQDIHRFKLDEGWVYQLIDENNCRIHGAVGIVRNHAEYKKMLGKVKALKYLKKKMKRKVMVYHASYENLVQQWKERTSDHYQTAVDNRRDEKLQAPAPTPTPTPALSLQSKPLLGHNGSEHDPDSEVDEDGMPYLDKEVHPIPYEVLRRVDISIIKRLLGTDQDSEQGSGEKDGHSGTELVERFKDRSAEIIL